MRALFYQANFCAECGNRLGGRRWWQHGCFCADCEARRGNRRYLLPVAFAVCGLVIGLGLGSRRETALDRMTLLGSAAPPSVSAEDAAVKLRPARVEQMATCGARTRRGAPCRHRTPAGQRCAQHRGQPSMLAGADGTASPSAAPKLP
jgi:hypothetical protein